MQPKEATIKAMEEVSGPVVAIGLILAAVFVPVGFMGGITGRLYQQFAITIALSVLLSVINALTLSPALAALLLKPAGGKKSFLQPFYNGFNKVFGWTTDRYVGFAGVLARKFVISLAFIGILMYVIVALVQRIPGGFVPEEDQGFIMVNALLPDAASLGADRRGDEEGRGDPGQDRGHRGIQRDLGLFAVDRRVLVEHGLLLRAAEGVGRPDDRRDARERHHRRVESRLCPADSRRRCRGVRTAVDSGLGTGAGFTMELQDRSGGSPDYLAQQTQRFIEAARKRPEIGRISTLYRATVPQIFADIDRSKALKSGCR